MTIEADHATDTEGRTEMTPLTTPARSQHTTRPSAARSRVARLVAGIALTACAALVLTGCGATDTVSQVKAGVDTGNYLSSVQPQLQAYGATLSGLDLAGPVSAANAKAFEAAEADMQQLASELDEVTPSEQYEAAHAKLIDNATETAGVLGDLAAASKENDKAAYDKAMTALTAGQAKFGEAMEAVAQPIVDAGK